MAACSCWTSTAAACAAGATIRPIRTAWAKTSVSRCSRTARGRSGSAPKMASTASIRPAAGSHTSAPTSGRFKNYTAKDGLIDGSYFVGSAASGADGELHFGGVNGMTSFQPDEIRDNPFPPPVVITDFLVQGRPRPLEGQAGTAREVD